MKVLNEGIDRYGGPCLELDNGKVVSIESIVLTLLEMRADLRVAVERLPDVRD